MVDTRFDFGITRVTPKQFENQVLWALEQGFTFHTLTDYFNSNSPNNKRIAVTFDDGYESVFTFAYPILKKYGLKATVFVNPDYCGKMNTWDVNIGWIKFPHLTWKQISELDDDGWEIGSHTMSHMDLTQIPNSLVYNELSDSLKVLKNKVSNFCPYISYPFGNTNKSVIEVCRKVGYNGGVIMGKSLSAAENKFKIPRIGVYLFDNKTTFMNKIYLKYMRIYFILQSMINICSNGTVMVKKQSWKNTKKNT